MKILLLKDCELGKVDELINVKDGYGQNFIINKGLGVLATEDLVLKRDERVSLQNKEKLNSLNKSNELKIEIEETFLTFERDFNGGKMFGSISNKEIAEELSKLNIDVLKRNIKMTKIYTLGNYIAKVNCGNSIIANLTIDVEAS